MLSQKEETVLNLQKEIRRLKNVQEEQEEIWSQRLRKERYDAKD